MPRADKTNRRVVPGDDAAAFEVDVNSDAEWTA